MFNDKRTIGGSNVNFYSFLYFFTNGDEEIETIPEWCPLEESTVPVTNQKIYKNYPLVDF